MTDQFELPFEHTVLAQMSASNRIFITVARNTRLHPFCTYDVAVDGRHCTNGGYHETRSAAYRDLLDRVMRRLK